MITEQALLPVFDSIDPNFKTVSVLKRSLLLRDGVEISRDDLRCAFAPGDIEAVKTFIGLTESPEITYLNAIWTQEAIDAYNAMLQANMPPQNGGE